MPFQTAIKFPRLPISSRGQMKALISSCRKYILVNGVPIRISRLMHRLEKILSLLLMLTIILILNTELRDTLRQTGTFSLVTINTFRLQQPLTTSSWIQDLKRQPFLRTGKEIYLVLDLQFQKLNLISLRLNAILPLTSIT